MSDYLNRIVARTQAMETPASAPEPAAVPDLLEADAADGPGALDPFTVAGEEAGALDPFAAEGEAAGAKMPGATNSSDADAPADSARPDRAAMSVPAPSMPLPSGRDDLAGASPPMASTDPPPVLPRADLLPIPASEVPSPSDAEAAPEAIIDIDARTVTSARIAPDEPAETGDLVILPISDFAGQGFVPALAPETAAGPAEAVIVAPQISIGRITVQVTVVPERPALPAARPAVRRAAPGAGPAPAPLRLRLGLGQM
jgi:hypothetical protein